MALISLSFNTGAKPMAEFYDGFALANGYQTTIVVDGESVANPESKAQFFRRLARNWAQRLYEDGLVRPAVNTAKTNILTDKVTLT